jgi:hypothetical protein
VAISQTEAPAAQANSGQTSQRKRTAVLVVHGIGSQRALETVRGVVEAAWLQDPDDSASDKPPREVWTHPEYSGVDIDLSVITTSGLSVDTPGGHQNRSIDFHELYWAHLMSETRAIAVLLWLFELVRKGPRLRPGLNPLWWVASTFLCVVVLSIVLLALAGIQLFSHVSCDHFGKACKLYEILAAPIFVISAIAFCVLLAALYWRAVRWIIPLLIAVAVSYGLLWLTLHYSADAAELADLLLPIAFALLLAWIIMKGWGALVLSVAYVVSSVLFMAYLSLRWPVHIDTIINHAWILWSLSQSVSEIIAFLFVFLYLALNALFLQSYLGDAARYFRNSPGNVAVRREIRKEAVETLDALHASGNYDRIIIVAHSLGTVIAYDMLRAYFSRICNNLPSPAALGPEVGEIDGMIVNENLPEQKLKFRKDAREVIRNIAAFEDTAPRTAGEPAKAAKWLVTDFVTLGSALTHAYYLMCDGDTYTELKQDFDRRVREREFPTCPPARLDQDGLLLFENPKTRKKEFHHGAVFGLTRWFNLYFPVHELLWGDAIGGPLKDIFGSYIEDIEVSTYQPARPAFFTHTEYWNLTWPGGRNAPQILALKAAINLEDKP